MNISIKTRAMKYGYSNARISGMLGLLLTKNDYAELIRMGNIAGMLEFLQRTSYKEDLKGLPPDNPESINIATTRHFSRIVKKVLSFTPNDDLPALHALTKKWAYLNMKIIIDAKKAGLSFSSIRAHLLDLPYLSVFDLEKAYDKDIDEIAQLVDKISQHNNQNGIGIGIQRQKEERDPYNKLKRTVEMNMYDFIYDPVFESSKELREIKRSLQKEVDARNLILILRLKNRSVGQDKVLDMLYPTGTVSINTLKNYIQLNYSDLVNVLAIKYKGIKVSPDMPVAKIETIVEKYITMERVNLFHASILSVGPIINFLLLKEQEMYNLQKIAKAKTLNIPEEDVKEELIIIR